MSDAEASGSGGSAATRDDSGRTTGPPIAMVLLAALCVVVGALLLLIDGTGAQITGYVACSIMTVLLIGLFRRFDLKRRLQAGYKPRPLLGRLIPVIMVAAFAVGSAHVWGIATELAS